MAKKIGAYPGWAVYGAKLSASETAALVVQGTAIGVNSNGEVRLADFRASQGPIPALGFTIEDAVRKDPKGNALDTLERVSWIKEGIVEGMSLVAGKYYYLSSGGQLMTNGNLPPAATTHDIDQVLGFALSATKLQINIGSPIHHA